MEAENLVELIGLSKFFSPEEFMPLMIYCMKVIKHKRCFWVNLV